jgi:hypothetical protein
MRLLLQIGLIFFALLSATLAEAQSAPPSQQTRQLRQFHQRPTETKPAANVSDPAVAPTRTKPAASVPEAPAAPAPPATQVAASLLDEPANPAQVQLRAGNLSIKADNSTLSGILHDISTETGMTVDGLSRDQRIFGSYGPAAPREVLNALLDGLGYNVIMVGALDNGAPRALTLSARTNSGPATGNRPTPAMRQQNNTGDEDDDATPEVQENPIQGRPETMYPPDANQQEQPQQPPPAAGEQQQVPGQVKTPQQMLQELQQMRQQQLQQQQANPQ